MAGAIPVPTQYPFVREMQKKFSFFAFARSNMCCKLFPVAMNIFIAFRKNGKFNHAAPANRLREAASA